MVKHKNIKLRTDRNRSIMIKVFLQTFFMISIFNSVLYSQTYYIDYQNGNNNNSGLSKTQAFKNSPGDPLATGNAASITLGPGDSLIFRADVEYLGQVVIPGSGTDNNGIVFKGTGWGNGRATFNLENTRGYAFRGSGRTHIKIEGFNIFNYSRSATGYPIYPSGSSAFWTIENCVIAYMEGWQNTTPFYAKEAILLSGVNNITIKSCEFFANGQDIIEIQNGREISILNNDFGGINRGDETGWFSVAIKGKGGRNITVRGNKFHDGWQYGGNVWEELNHAPAYIHVYGTADGIYTNADPYNWIIERNYFYNDLQIFQGTGTGDIEITTDCKKFYIRNNLVVNTTTHNTANILLSNRADSIWVENNTFIMRNYSGTAPGEVLNNLKIYTMGGLTGAGDSIWIRNNIFWNENEIQAAYTVHLTDAGTFGGVIDYNAHFCNPTKNYPVYIGGQKSFAAYRGYGFDINGQLYATSTTLFEDLPLSPENTSLGNYGLDDVAPAFLKTGGLTLNGFFEDFIGATRTPGWSIGALEFGSVIVDNIPPKLQSVVIQAPNTLELFFSESIDPQNVQIAGNYSINSGIIVNSAVLVNSSIIRLTTSDHLPNQEYTIIVNDITDLAGNVIDPNYNSGIYSYASDTTPPELVGATAIDSITVELIFSEALEGSSSQNTANYSISGGIAVTQATLSSDLTKVTLNTSVHSSGSVYTITTINLRDLANNLISPEHNSFVYEYIDQTFAPMILPIDYAFASSWSQNYSPDKSIDGLIASSSRWSGDHVMPDTILYSLSDVHILNSTKISFYRWYDARIYNYTVQTSADGISWQDVIVNVPSALNEQLSVQNFNPIEAKFIRVISLSSNQSDYTGIYEVEFWGHLKVTTEIPEEEILPNDFKLEQNFPNPFNPTTRISYSLASNSEVKLRVFDLLGNIVAELVDENQTAGNYQVQFKAENLSSGIYFYRLETNAFSETRKMVLLK